MWICREKERKKKNRHWSNGQVSTDHGNMERRGLRATVSESYPWLKVIEKRVLLWNGWQKWSGICLCMLTCLRASQSVGVGLLDHGDAISECLPHRWANMTDRQIRQRGGRTDAVRQLDPSQPKLARRWACSVFADGTVESPVSTVLSALSTLPLSPLAAAPKTQESSWECLYGSDSNMGKKCVKYTHAHTYVHTQCRSPSMHLLSHPKLFYALTTLCGNIWKVSFLKLCSWS